MTSGTSFARSVWLVCLALIPLVTAADLQVQQNSTQAYVTLLYGDDFLLGVRVLGQSIKDTGTTRDRVVLVAGEVSEYATLTLKADGWIVRPVDAVDNPSMRDDGKFPARFWAVYSKLHVFGLTDYEKVIYLDADTIVVHKIDDVFGCPGFCATLRHSERFNSGVMSLTPSKSVFDDMIESIASTSSYTGGDQGFLNAYFKDFASSPVFDPSKEYLPTEHKSMMLPSRYNADIGLYVFNSNRWLLEGQPKVVHYTLGSFKPWSWWCGWLIEEQVRWSKYRMKLGPDAHGRKHGITAIQSFAQSWMPLFPIIILALLGRGVMHGWPSYVAPLFKWLPSIYPRHPIAALNVTCGFLCLGLSALLAGLVTPAFVTPSWGWILVYEYMFMFMAIFYGKYLHFCAVAGRQPGVTHVTANKGLANQPPWYSTAICAATLTTCLLVCPVLNTLLGIPGFVPKILLTVAGGLVTTAVATHMFSTLAKVWFYQIQPFGAGYL